MIWYEINKKKFDTFESACVAEVMFGLFGDPQPIAICVDTQEDLDEVSCTEGELSIDDYLPDHIYTTIVVRSGM